MVAWGLPWKLKEIVSMGTLSKILTLAKNLSGFLSQREEHGVKSTGFGVQQTLFESLVGRVLSA